MSAISSSSSSHQLSTTTTITTTTLSPPPPPPVTTTPLSCTTTAPISCTNEAHDVIKRSSHPDYVQTLTVRDANGTVRELVFPKGLDLDRPKRARTTFSTDQLNTLEREFRRNQYLVGRERSLLATRLGLSETQVKVWYQNRRTKHKRDREREHETPNPGLATRPTPLTLIPPVTTPYTLPNTPKLSTFKPTHTTALPSTPTNSNGLNLGESGLICEAPEGIGRSRSPVPANSVPAKITSPHREGGLEYNIGGMKSDLNFGHALETRWSKSLPTLLGSFHSVPHPGMTQSAFRPLLPRPLHPLGMQHHALARPHSTWLP